MAATRIDPGAARQSVDSDKRAATNPPPIVRRVEISSSGIDEYLQGIGGDADGTSVSTGLRVPNAPFAAPSELNPMGVGRYLFQLVTIKVGLGRRVKLLSLRQLLTIGKAQPPGDFLPQAYVLERPVTDIWRFPDGNVCWYLRRVPGRMLPPRQPTDAQNFRYRFSDSSSSGCLVYEDFTASAANLNPQGAPDYYTQITGYVPPYGGKPYGVALSGQLGCFRDIRYSSDSTSLNEEIEGPCSVVFYASVRQTSGLYQPTFPEGNPNLNNGPSPPDAFLNSFTGIRYWRIGGSIVYEDMAA